MIGYHGEQANRQRASLSSAVPSPMASTLPNTILNRRCGNR